MSATKGFTGELCSLIVVGRRSDRAGRARGDKEQDIARMERRVQDLRITQVASTQLAAQIRAVQASDELTCSRLQAALEVTIPLWKSQMAAALGLARATDSLTMQKRAGEEAARGIKSGARELSAQTRAYAEAADGSDQTRAQQTADALLAELSEIELRWPNSRKSAALTQAQKEGFDYARLCHPNHAEADAEQSAAAKETKAGSAERPCRPAAERGNRRAGRDGRAGAAHRQFPRAAKCDAAGVYPSGRCEIHRGGSHQRRAERRNRRPARRVSQTTLEDVNNAIKAMQSAKTARDISRADQQLTVAVSQLVDDANLANAEDEKMLTRAADTFAEQGSFLRQEARAYNQKAEKAEKLYEKLPTRFLLSQPDIYEGI